MIDVQSRQRRVQRESKELRLTAHGENLHAQVPSVPGACTRVADHFQVVTVAKQYDEQSWLDICGQSVEVHPRTGALAELVQVGCDVPDKPLPWTWSVQDARWPAVQPLPTLGLHLAVQCKGVIVKSNADSSTRWMFVCGQLGVFTRALLRRLLRPSLLSEGVQTTGHSTQFDVALHLTSGHASMSRY